jgi:dachs protein
MCTLFEKIYSKKLIIKNYFQKKLIFRGLTIKTHNARNGQLTKLVCDVLQCYKARDSLAKALYCRTVATIVRRANSLKR